MIGGSAETSSVATCVPSSPKPLRSPFQVRAGRERGALEARGSGTLGVRTSSHTSLSARYLPLVAITRILPLPSFEPERSVEEAELLLGSREGDRASPRRPRR